MKLKKIKIIILLFILITLFTFIQAFSYSHALSSSLKNNILRLHILANSNSSQDQLFKLKCRDNIISYLNQNIDYTTATKEDITLFLSSHITNLYEICYKTAADENINTTFNISLCTSHFPTKQYGNILMPQGNYDCLKIEIGNSIGNNWWCSLYPPLCFTENSTNINLSNNIDNINSVKSSTLYKE